MNGNWDTTTLNWQLLAGSIATNYAEGSLSAFDDSATGSSPITVTLAANRSPGGITNNSTKNYILAGSASITGSGTIIKDGSSTLTIDNSGPNVLSAVTISGGTLQVGNGDANGDLGSATVTDNSTLVFNRTDNITSANVVSGAGSLVQNGGGILTLSAANTYSNLTIINSGQLVLANVSAAQNSTVSNNVANGLGFDSSITASTIGGLAGNGDITLNNAASVVVTLTAGGNNTTTTYGGSLGGSGSLSKTGTNTLTLSGSSILSSLGAGGGMLAA
jgi:autotransporter-associated beta strand protein